MRLVFDETAKRRGVYLFDEFDASVVIAVRRMMSRRCEGYSNRFCNSWKSRKRDRQPRRGCDQPSDLLDRALLRRFDLVVQFEMPSDEQIRSIVKAYLRPMKYPKLAWKQIVEAGRDLEPVGAGQGDGEGGQTAILDERDRLTTRDIVAALNERREMRQAFIGVQVSR